MIDIKTPEEIEIMKIGGKMLADTLFEVLDKVRPGMTEIEVDALSDRLIVKKGGEAAFKKVKGYHHATCISTNNVVVHGIPTDYKLKEGDVLGIDCGVFYKGFYTDMSETIRVSAISHQPLAISKNDEFDKFLKTGKRALRAGIEAAVGGNRVGDISKAIQDIVEGGGYSVVRSLIGHGVGRALHEEPEVPGYLNKKIGKTSLLRPGMTIAIEVIYNMGGFEVSYINADGWTIATSDGSLSGLFERTIAITDNKPLILTTPA